MLLIVGVLVLASVLAAVYSTKSSNFMHAHPLGWMSERWLAEHRAAEHL